MTFNGVVQLLVYIVVLIALAKPIGWYMARVYDGQSVGLNRVFAPVERLLYRVFGTRDDEEMDWKTYAVAMLLFNALGLLTVYALQRLQAVLPLNPQGLGAVTPDSSFNTAISFASNTNWQGYSGEVTMSYLTQMLGLNVQNFVSAASGMAVLVALIRGLRGRTIGTIGNFWVDLTRSVLYILLPLSLLLALFQVSQGVVQSFAPYQTVQLVQPLTDGDGNAVTTQTIPLGPAASQIAIKQLGTNGGGFFNVNSAHPLENPTPLANFFEMLAILLIPAGLCYTFGKMVGDTRQGWAVLAAMTLIFVPLLFGVYAAEGAAPPLYDRLGIDTVSSDVQAGGNMEGKETRFGIAASTTWAAATTAASNGSVNSMHGSYTPLGGLVPMFLMMLGEVVFGGVGSGLYGMLIFAIIAVFIAGLMVGRTPEYLGKKIEAYEIKMASLVILIPPAMVLLGAALAVATGWGRGALYDPDVAYTSIYNPGAHGFSEVLYAFTIVLVEAGDTVPMDGEAIEGVASVDESAITGESALVIRESGGDRSAVTGGTRVLSDWLIVRVTANPGETFLDRMIAMVEGAKRQKTPNEIALNILLAALTIIFLLAVVTLLPFSLFAVQANGSGQAVSVTVLVALLVCLIPTTIGGLLSAIGIAGMDRMIQANVIAMSGRAVEAAGDVDVLLLDKTGTITLGNRQATAFHPAHGVTEQALADAAQLSSLADETPEGRSIVVLAKEKYNIRERDITGLGAEFVPFTAQTRMSGVNLNGSSIRKGSVDAIERYVSEQGSALPAEVRETVDSISKQGGTPLVVADGANVLGTVQLKDIVKGGIKERFAELRRMGIKTVMITGDNPLTAAAIAAEAGVDDFLAQATPEAKLALIREYQQGGRLVAMTGDGTNDAPALAQADVAVAMNSGTQAAKEAGNMVDLDSNPTKLIEVVEIGKQLLMTRGALTTFSIANDIAKYVAIIPAAFATTYPVLNRLNIMGLTTPESAIASAVIFNALIIMFLIPLALRGVKYRAVGAAQLLQRNLLIYGLGGVVAPFVGIKIIDMLLALVGWV